MSKIFLHHSGMSSTLPPILPTKKNPAGVGRGVSRHAQNFSTSKLQQRKDVEEAGVSISQLTKRRAAGPQDDTEQTGPSTSIAHGPRKDDREMFSDEQRQEARDRLRYSYIRKKIKERKAAEKALAKAANKAGIKIDVGKAYRASGVTGFRKKFSDYIRGKRGSLKHISKADQKLFTDAMESVIKGKASGSAVSRLDRKKIKGTMYKAYKKGDITKTDYNSFKKIIDDLH